MAAKETSCFGCKKAFTADNKAGVTYTLEALGHRYHRECLKCAKCGKGLWSEELFELAGQPSCKTCANSGTDTTKYVSCKGCGKQISGSHLNAWGHRWHNECAVCAHCKKRIEGAEGFFDDDINKPVHLACLR